MPGIVLNHALFPESPDAKPPVPGLALDDPIVGEAVASIRAWPYRAPSMVITRGVAARVFRFRRRFGEPTPAQVETVSEYFPWSARRPSDGVNGPLR